MQNERYNIFLKTVGNNIRKIRNEKGLSMETLANEAGIEYRQLGRIERGEVNTTVISLVKIADALNVSASDFLL